MEAKFPLGKIPFRLYPSRQEVSLGKDPCLRASGPKAPREEDVMWHLVAEAFQPATAAFILAVVILKLLEWRRGALRDERKRMERIIAPIVEGAFDNSVRKFLELDRNRWMSQSDDVRSGLGSYLQC